MNQRGDAINSKLARKSDETCISGTNGDRKMKIKRKRNSEVRYLFMNLFSQNFEILAPCCDFIISKLGQKDSICVSCRTGGKNIKVRNYNNFGSKFFF